MSMNPAVLKKVSESIQERERDEQAKRDSVLQEQQQREAFARERGRFWAENLASHVSDFEKLTAHLPTDQKDISRVPRRPRFLRGFKANEFIEEIRPKNATPKFIEFTDRLLASGHSLDSDFLAWFAEEAIAVLNESGALNGASGDVG